MSMLFKRFKDWATSITAFRMGDVIPVDGPSGTAKMGKDDLLRVTAQNALAGNVAPAFSATKPNGSDGYAYHIDDIVSRQGIVYRFIADKPSGAWDASYVVQDNIASLIFKIFESIASQYKDGKPYKANDFVMMNFELRKFWRVHPAGGGSGDYQSFPVNIAAYIKCIDEQVQKSVSKGMYPVPRDTVYFMDGLAISTATGTSVAGSGYSTTQYIACDYEFVKTIRVVVPSVAESKPIGLAFFSNAEGSAFISSRALPISEDSMVQIDVDVPQNAKYVRLTFVDSSSPNFDDWSFNLILKSELPYSDNEAEKDVTSAFKFSNELYGIEWATGKDRASSALINCDLIDVSNVSKIRITTPIMASLPSQTVMGCAFYGSNGLFLEGIPFTSSTDIGVESRDIDIPAGAKYFRTCWFGNTHVPAGASFNCKFIYNVDECVPVNSQELFLNKAYILGAPHIYHALPVEDEDIHLITTNDIYPIYDNLVTNHPHWIQRRQDIGVDEDNQALRRYEIRMMSPFYTDTDHDENNVYDYSYDYTEIILTAGVHGHEKGGALGLAKFIEDLITSSEDWAVFIKSNFIIHVIPIVNPWGFNNTSAVYGGSRENKNGIDINRDFISFTTNSAKAVRDFVTSRKGRVKVLLDCHSSPRTRGMLVTYNDVKLRPIYIKVATRLAALMQPLLVNLYQDYPSQYPYFFTYCGKYSGSETWWANQNGMLANSIELPARIGIAQWLSHSGPIPILKEALSILVQCYGSAVNDGIRRNEV